MVTETDTDPEETIRSGDYIVVQRGHYFKLHQLSDGNVVLGKDKVAVGPLVGHKYWTTFKMIPKPGHRREYKLELSDRVSNLSQPVFIKELTSGTDNRDIVDDGTAQAMTTEQIIEMRDSGVSPEHVLGQLIANSKTFRNKTEYSQEKYLRKKQTKYYEYLTVRKPTLRLLAEIYFDRDQTKVMGLRYDTLSQIVTAINVREGATYMLYESGTQALIAAAILNSLRGGALINISLGNQPQKQAVLAMNFASLDNFLCVKATSLIQSLFPDKMNPESAGNTTNTPDIPNNVHTENSEQVDSSIDDSDKLKIYGDIGNESSEGRKRKAEEDEGGEEPQKRPRWALELETASNLLLSQGADALVIASKEFPLNLVTKLIPFVKPSRPLVIYSLYREPLVELYVELKKRGDVINIHLTETWLRCQQVLPDRTHPNVTMSPSGGHLLTATIIRP